MIFDSQILFLNNMSRQVYTNRLSCGGMVFTIGVEPRRAYHQDVAVALALCEHFLQGRGAYRVHGGGFAGTAAAVSSKSSIYPMPLPVL